MAVSVWLAPTNTWCRVLKKTRSPVLSMVAWKCAMSGLDTRDGARRLASRSSSTNCTAPVRCTLWAKHACTQRMRPSAWRRRRFRLPAPGAAPGNNSGAIRSWSSGCSSQCRSGRLCSNCAALQPSRASGCPSTATRVGSGASSKVKTTSGGQGMRPWFPGKFLLGKGTTRPHSYAGTRPLSLLTPGAGGFLCSARCTGFCSRPGCSPALVRAWHGMAWIAPGCPAALSLAGAGPGAAFKHRVWRQSAQEIQGSNRPLALVQLALAAIKKGRV